MIRQWFKTSFSNMLSEAAEKLSQVGTSITEDELSDLLRPHMDLLQSRIEEDIIKMRETFTLNSLSLELEKERIKKECDQKLASSEKELELARVKKEHAEQLKSMNDELNKTRAELTKYKRLHQQEEEECSRQKAWNQALVNKMKEKGIELPKEIPHTYTPPKTQPNSDNSSLPPSKNPIGYRGYKKRPKSDKKTGGQIGHPGRNPHLKNPSQTVEHSRERCPHCNNSLHGVEGKEAETRQVVDIPQVVDLNIVNHVSIKKKCPHCGSISVGEFPDGVNAHYSYGPHIIATAVLLCHYMNCSWNKIISFFEFVYGIHLSQGTLANFFKRFALNCEEDYQKIKEAIKSGKVVHADETVITVDGKRRQYWIFITEGAVYMIYNRTRCMEVLLEEFPYGLPESVLVTDRYAAYFNKAFKVKNHQVCLPHLIRNLRGLLAKAPNCKWVARIKNLLERAMRAHRDLTINREELFLELDELLDKEPEFVDPKERKTVIKFFHNLQKVKNYILLFLIEDGVPHNNNRAERGLRPSKSKLKQAGTFRSEAAPDQYAKTLSLIQTWKTDSKNIFENIVAVASRNKKKPRNTPELDSEKTTPDKDPT